ncbi:MAG: hypothetical protein ACYC6L_06985 [Anaerolineae bacterium]
MKKGWVFILGAMVGGALGWVAGVLSAPRAGMETMSAISDKAIELSNIMGFAGASVTPQPESQAAEAEAECEACEQGDQPEAAAAPETE